MNFFFFFFTKQNLYELEPAKKVIWCGLQITSTWALGLGHWADFSPKSQPEIY